MKRAAFRVKRQERALETNQVNSPTLSSDVLLPYGASLATRAYTMHGSHILDSVNGRCSESSKSESHLLAAAQAPSQASARGGDNVPAPTHSVSSRSLASTSASVRVKLPRSRSRLLAPQRRGKGTAAEVSARTETVRSDALAAASSRRAQSALEGDRSFWVGWPLSA
eukprot:2330970-Rhodomonas_salina.2